MTDIPTAIAPGIPFGYAAPWITREFTVTVTGYAQRIGNGPLYQVRIESVRGRPPCPPDADLLPRTPRSQLADYKAGALAHLKAAGRVERWARAFA